MSELTMIGHDRTYLPPRSVRTAVRGQSDPVSLQIGTGNCTAWDLLQVGGSHPASSWAIKTLESITAAGSDLGCGDCEDTGFYGLASTDDVDLLDGLLRRIGDGEYESLRGDGIWEQWNGDVAQAEVLSLELAGDVADALTAGATGLLRKYSWPLFFLPPAKVVTASLLADLVSAEEPDTPRSEWVNFAVVDDDDPGAVMQVVRAGAEDRWESYQEGAWEHWDPIGNLYAIPLDDEVLEVVLTASGLVADAPLTVSPDPRAEKLRRYWSTGRGGAKIRWNTPGDWRRCVRQLRKYLGVRAKGWCQNMHKRSTGVWTGDRRNRGLRSDAGSVLSGAASRSCLITGDAETGPSGFVPHVFRDREIVEFVLAEGSATVASLLVEPSQNRFQVIGVDVTPVETDVTPGTRRIEVVQNVVKLVSVGDGSSMDKPRSLVSGSGTEPSRGVTVSVGQERPFPEPLTVRHDGVVRLELLKVNGQGDAVVPLAHTASGLTSAALTVVHTADHKIYCRHLACGSSMDASSLEETLLAALHTGYWAKQEEGDNMPSLVGLDDGIYSEVEMENMGLLRTLTAGGFPVSPPDEWYSDPQFSGPTPMEVDDDGRVRGHIATWDVTHIGMAGAVHAPKSKSGYAYFMTGALKTASGKQVNVGQLTLSGGHAPLHADAGAAVKHYDDTNSAVADVAVGEDAYGIWAAGSLRPNITPEQVRVFRASPLSGDWRPINGNLELVAACAVNVPGFVNVRAQARVAGGAILALVAAGARPLAVRRASLTADAAVLERLDSLEARIPVAAPEVQVMSDGVAVLHATDPVTVTPGTSSASAEVEVVPTTAEVTPATAEVAVSESIAAPEVEPVAASTAVAEAPVLEEQVAEAVAAAEQNTPEEVQPEPTDKLDPDQVKQAREEARAIRRDWLRSQVHKK
jgi:hypothetical protein